MFTQMTQIYSTNELGRCAHIFIGFLLMTGATSHIRDSIHGLSQKIKWKENSGRFRYGMANCESMQLPSWLEATSIC
jgi:hypothetical protein